MKGTRLALCLARGQEGSKSGEGHPQAPQILQRPPPQPHSTLYPGSASECLFYVFIWPPPSDQKAQGEACAVFISAWAQLGTENNNNHR